MAARTRLRAFLAGEWDVLRSLDHLAGALEAGRLPRPWTQVDLRAAIVFHTEMVVRGLDEPAKRRGWQLRVSRRLADSLTARVQDSAGDTSDDAAFLRRWHLVMAWQAQGAFELDDASAEVDALRRLCPADTEILLTDGTVSETQAWPALRSSALRPLTHPRTRRGRASLLADAEARYREVLARSPASSEGALRLGRVLHEQGRYRRRWRCSAPCWARRRTSGRRTWAACFAGAACERMDRLDEAAAHYRTAREFRPGAQTAAIALSFVLRRSGGQASARSALARLAAPTGQNSDNPWWIPGRPVAPRGSRARGAAS